MDLLTIVKTFIEGIFFVLIIPGVPIGLFWLSVRLSWLNTNVDRERPRRVWAWWLGMAIFFLVVGLSLFTDALAVREPLPIVEALWIHLAIGISAGFVLLALFEELRKSSLVAIVITVLSGGSLTSLYFYVFVENLRVPIIVYAPSLVVGALAYIVFVSSGREGLPAGTAE